MSETRLRNANSLKPYPKYKDSGQDWLGKVPAHWVLKPGQAAFSKQKISNAGLKEKTVLSLSYGHIKIKALDKQHGLVPESYATYQIVDKGNIIIRGTDLQNDHTSLRIGLVHTLGIITSAYLCLMPRTTVSPEYGFQILHTFDLTKAIYRYGTGLRQNLDHGEIKRLPIFLPPLNEQAAIVRFLDHANRKIDGFIRAKKKLISLLNEQKQAIIQRAVTRGLNPDVKLKPSGIPWLGDIPEHWETISVRTATNLIQTGPFGSQLHSHEYVRGGTPIINPSHMQNGKILHDTDVSVSEEKAIELMRHRLALGDIVVARRGELGRCGLVTEQEVGWLCGTGSLLVRCKGDTFCPGYFQELFSSKGVCDLLQLSSIGATMDNLNAGMVARLRFPFPPIREQIEILQFLDEKRNLYETENLRISREIALMQEYRARLTADIVTGKLDVREAAARLPEVFESSHSIPDVLDSEEEIADVDGE